MRTCLALFFCALLIWARPAGAGQLTADQVIAKAVARCEQSEQSRPPYSYAKTSIVEEIDAKGRVKERKEKYYEARAESGLTYLRLTKIAGQKLSAAELSKENERETRERAKLATKKPAGGDDRENFLTAGLVTKYAFHLIDTPQVNGRVAYHLRFAPKSDDLPIKEFMDRLLNRLSGELWIDQEDFEISKAEVRLGTEVTLWGGILGSLKKFSFALERTRLADGTWFNRLSNGEFEGRKLVESIRYRTHSESTGFKPITRTARLSP